MMNIIDFLFGNEIRIEPHEGFKKCILNYCDGIFAVSCDKENTNTIATFYVRDDCVIPEIISEGMEESKVCFIQEELYASSLDDTVKEYADKLLNLLSQHSNCTSDCTMESGCKLMQNLLSLKCNLEWTANWADVILGSAEERIMDWIYGA